MILLIGDLHFDPRPSREDLRRAAVSSADDVRDLAACLRALPERPSTAVLLGDVFDAYVEYRHTIPKPPIALLGVLADWAGRGSEICYTVGNHDPWHRSWIESDLGWTLLRGGRTLSVEGIRLHVAHGDGLAPPGLWTRFVRSRWALRLYAGLLPGDSGQGLAAAVSRRVRTQVPPETAAHDVRERAVRILEDGTADVVALAHSHIPALERMAAGWYVNPGHWPATRTIGLIENGVPHVARWNGSGLENGLP